MPNFGMFRESADTKNTFFEFLGPFFIKKKSLQFHFENKIKRNSKKCSRNPRFSMQKYCSTANLGPGRAQFLLCKNAEPDPEYSRHP